MMKIIIISLLLILKKNFFHTKLRQKLKYIYKFVSFTSLLQLTIYIIYQFKYVIDPSILILG